MFHDRLTHFSAVLCAVGMLALTSCASAVPSGEEVPSDAPDVLSGTGWVLDSLGGEPLLDGTSATLMFSDDGTVAGTAGCNRFNGAFTSVGNELTFEPLATTMMACQKPTMEQETSLLRMLEDSKFFAIKEDALTLSDGDELVTLVFLAQSQQLEGTSWIISGYNDGAEAVVNVMSDSVSEVSFGEDGLISGTGGCNRLTGEFTASEGQLEVGTLGMTQMACPEPAGVMEQEMAVVKALESATAYLVEGDSLTLSTDDGATAMLLTRG